MQGLEGKLRSFWVILMIKIENLKMDFVPFAFYLTAISSNDTKRAKPRSALGIQLMTLASDHTKHQVLQPQTDFRGT